MKYELRYYQQKAVEEIWKHIRTKENNPCAVLPTGSGKTIVLAQLCKDVVAWDGRVLLLSHVKELLAQGYEKINSMVDGVSVGLYSAGLNRRDTINQVLVAGIQSVFKRACELGAFDIIIIDECHLIPTEAEGRYTTFLKDMMIVNPNVRIIGLTATDYRLKGGKICKKGNILNEVCYEVGIKELQSKGYLSKLSTKKSLMELDDSKFHKKMGEFIDSELEEAMNTQERISGAVEEIKEYGVDRNSCLIFCISIDHAQNVMGEIRLKCEGRCEILTGKTPAKERDLLLQEFKAGLIKYIVNVNVLTVGFDAPNIDMIAMMRPTASAGLYYQKVGRGLRTCDGKSDCLILDFSGNVFRHGPIDQIVISEKSDRERGDGIAEAPVKTCENCQEVVAISYTVCPVCGEEFPEIEGGGHGSRANLEDIISGGSSKSEMERMIAKVTSASCDEHEKEKDGGVISRTLKVSYELEGDLFNWPVNEWICLEHGGWAGSKALEWWIKATDGAFNESDVDRSWKPSVTELINEYIDYIKIPQYIEIERKVDTKYWTVVNRFYQGDKECESLDLQSKQESYDDEPDWVGDDSQGVSIADLNDSDIPF